MYYGLLLLLTSVISINQSKQYTYIQEFNWSQEVSNYYEQFYFIRAQSVPIYNNLRSVDIQIRWNILSATYVENLSNNTQSVWTEYDNPIAFVYIGHLAWGAFVDIPLNNSKIIKIMPNDIGRFELHNQIQHNKTYINGDEFNYFNSIGIDRLNTGISINTIIYSHGSGPQSFTTWPACKLQIKLIYTFEND